MQLLLTHFWLSYLFSGTDFTADGDHLDAVDDRLLATDVLAGVDEPRSASPVSKDAEIIAWMVAGKLKSGDVTFDNDRPGKRTVLNGTTTDDSFYANSRVDDKRVYNTVAVQHGTDNSRVGDSGIAFDERGSRVSTIKGYMVCSERMKVKEC